MANFFPRWCNWLPLQMAIAGILIACGLTAATWYYVTPKYTRVGYQPIQPVPFPHDIHVTQLGMDCRYCHNFVEVAAHSNLQHPNVHELPLAGAKGQSEARTGARKLEDRQTDRVGAGP